MQLAANTLKVRKIAGSVPLTTGGVPFSVHSVFISITYVVSVQRSGAPIALVLVLSLLL